MKQIIILLLLLPPALSLMSQKKAKKEEAFYMLDENFKGVPQEKAKYFIHAEKKNDTCWQFDMYHLNGSLMTSEQYKDEKGTILHGESVYFNEKGTRDSIGHFANDLPHGSFYYLNDTGKIFMQKEFRGGALVETIDRIKKDSIDKAM